MKLIEVTSLRRVSVTATNITSGQLILIVRR